MNFCETVSQNQGFKLALAQLRGSVVLAMPFTEDDMFSTWNPNNEGGRDLSVGDFQCIQVKSF